MLAYACKAPAVALAAVESGLLTDIVCWMCKVLEGQGHEGAQVGLQGRCVNGLVNQCRSA